MNSFSNISVRRCRPLLGTFVEIAAWGDAPGLDTAVDAAFDAIGRVQSLLSFHDPSSELSRVNRDATRGPVTVDSTTFSVIEAALDLARESNGAFDPTVAEKLCEWGILPEPPAFDRSIQPGTWRDVDLYKCNQVRFARPLLMDLGGIAKGFAVDRAVEALLGRGVESGLVNAGGDLRVFGPRGQLVHVRDPRFPERMVHALELRDAALATSAPTFSRRVVQDGIVSHLVDPANGTAHVADSSVSVLAPNCMLADALTKVVLFGGPGAEAVLARHRAEAFMLCSEATPLAA